LSVIEKDLVCATTGRSTRTASHFDKVTYDKAAVQAYIDANAYKGKRRAEYPSIQDQFDLLYHGGYDAWKAAIDAVKTKYPKG